MRVIFLDIDGVLNSHQFYDKRHRSAEGIILANPDWTDKDEICPESIANLNTLVEATGAKVVISSTWRHGRKVEWFQTFFKDLEFTGEIIGLTPDMRGRSIVRGNEIHRWIADHEFLLGCHASDYRDYVILDDDSDMLYWQRNNFLCIDGHVGLTPTMAYRAARIFGVTISATKTANA